MMIAPIPCHAVAFHGGGRHFDEDVSHVWFRVYGEELFPGAARAVSIEWPTGNPPDGRSAEAWETEGVIAFGCAHGRFDEHREEGGRIKDECSATLLAKYLGWPSNQLLRDLLKFTLDTDQGTAQHPFDASSLLQKMKRQADDLLTASQWAQIAIIAIIAEARNGVKPRNTETPLLRPVARLMGITQGDHRFEKINNFIDRTDCGEPEHPFDLASLYRLIHNRFPKESRVWVEMALKAIRDEQLAFYACAPEFSREARVRILKTRRGTLVPVCLIRSSNNLMAKFARSEEGCEAAIVIQQHESGNVQIFPENDRISRSIMWEIYNRLNSREPKHWYYHFGMSLNGADSHKMPPTDIDPDGIAHMISRVVRSSMRF